MSDPDYITVIASEYYDILVNNYCVTAASVVFIYEYIITFGTEVELFWTQPKTGATMLFLLNRGIVMFFTWYDMITNFLTQPSSIQSCADVVKTTLVFEVLQYIPWAAFSSLRAFAIARSWPLSILVFALSIVPVAINLADFAFDFGGVLIPPFGCVSTDTVSVELALRYVPPIPAPFALCAANRLSRFTIASRACLIAADALLILLTWRKLYRGDANTREKGGFVHVLLRDGTIYFLVLVVQNILHLTLTLLSISTVLQNQNVSVVALFTEPLTAILVSRFLIDLQVANRRSLNKTSGLHSEGGVESLVFERVIGSLGSSIDPGGSEGDVDDESDGWITEVTDRNMADAERADLETPTSNPFILFVCREMVRAMDVASEYQSIIVESYSNYAIAALVAYDYIITLNQEVDLFWGGEFTAAFALFISNRYFYLLYVVLGAALSRVPVEAWGGDCALLQKVFFGLDTIPYSIWAYFSALRAYALSASWTLGLLVLVLSMGPVGANLLNDVCSVTTTSRISLAAADVVLILLTWLRLRRSGGEALRKGRSFPGVLMCDGMVYFL
ncbi:hypothetical protein L226DRAFT_614371 [Lentinus tigrinus ALCF2SS1-7]|uniref:uncharacterized protein n=1 Tax=Lentinus tigrinus ALCF2SS1-7 TaxID=1328758 RepID=UPI001165FB05|nr:hypothetical protein L226DRAFT_614371 [Lentinus tigrinus ALCF2SS1-7]